MFIDFFYKLKEMGVPVSPTSFLRLQRALSSGLVNSVDDFYTAARTILIKSERHFDIYDQIFAWYFQGADPIDEDSLELDEMARAMLEEWLQNPREMADALGIDEKELAQYSPEALIDYFKKRLNDQKERHDGGNKWIGTGGTSPVGHSGHHPGGMRVGGVSKNRSAVKLAGERRYRDYSGTGPLTQAHIGEALKRLRNLTPAGPKDRLNIDESIYQTLKNGGEIELIFDQSLKDRLKVILMIDNGGWSMEPYVHMVQTLFDYARAQFKDVKTYFFHNTIYDTVWLDPSRYGKPTRVDDFSRVDANTRLIILGDASMAPYELFSRDGSIYVQDRSGKTSIERLRFLAETFPHCVWLNPTQASMWGYTRTIETIAQVIPMFELSLDGLEAAISHLMEK